MSEKAGVMPAFFMQKKQGTMLNNEKTVVFTERKFGLN